MYYPPTGSLKGCASDCRKFAKEMFCQEQVHTASGRFEIPFIMNYINVQLRLISSDVQMTYRWCTDDVQMTYRWDPINLSEMHEGIVYQICWINLKCLHLAQAVSCHEIIVRDAVRAIFLFKSFEWVIVGGWLVGDTYNLVLLCKSPFVFRKSLNEWLLVIGWWNKGDLNPWPPNTLVVAVSGLMMVGVGLLVIRFNWGWDQLFEETSWRPSSDGPGVGRGCQGIMIRIQ